MHFSRSLSNPAIARHGHHPRYGGDKSVVSHREEIEEGGPNVYLCVRQPEQGVF